MLYGKKIYFVKKLNKTAISEYQVNIDCYCLKNQQAEEIL